MGRMIGAILAGYALWSVLWVGGTLLAGSLFPERLTPGQPSDDVALLVGLIVYSGILSVASGWVAAAIGRTRAQGAGRGLAGLLLITGIGFEVSAWELTPVWYHLVFLALLVPLTLFGARLRSERG